MTRKEVIKILRPKLLSEDYTGGVYGCPCGNVFYNGRNFYFDNNVCMGNCTRCWNEKLSIRESASFLSAVGVEVVRAYMRAKKNESVQK